MMKFDANEVLGHLRYKISNANVQEWPFSHFFPDAFYRQLRSILPPKDAYKTGASHYNGRVFAEKDAVGELNFLTSEEFLESIVFAFNKDFQRRFPQGQFVPKQDLRLTLDSENYAIGPHTDARWKVVSLLFYLPEDYALERLGTSIYIPKDRNFRCAGGPHYKFDDFTRVATAPFRPNSLLGFFKTDYSFHGVEPITIPCRRDVLLWNLYAAQS
jgi:hypothetical protein